MRTVLNGPTPKEVRDLLARRRALGLDSFDEVWDGEYHMNPSPNARHGQVQFQLAVVLDPLLRGAGLIPILEFNLGIETNYRVPDLGGLRVATSATWVDDAALVVEVLSPSDETFDKFVHYAAFGVVEVLVADPEAQSIRIFQREADGASDEGADHVDVEGVDVEGFDDRLWPFTEVTSSGLLGLEASALTERLEWPDP